MIYGEFLKHGGLLKTLGPSKIIEFPRHNIKSKLDLFTGDDFLLQYGVFDE